MKNLILLIFTMLIVSCTNKTKGNNVSEVISFMIDKKAFPLPPPPLNGTSSKVKDSLLNLKLKVALFPIMEDVEVEKIPEEYRYILKNQDGDFEKLRQENVYSKKGHQIIMADTIELKKSKDFNSFDLLFHFSKLYYSKDKQKVFFELGVSRSRLAGQSTFYVLKKQNDKWGVEYSKPLSIW